MTDGQSPLILKKLDIRRMAGLAQGFSLDELSAGVNVIYGPNGVGKSRTARALNLILWPGKIEQDGRDAVAGWFDLGAESWGMDLDAGDVRYQRGGADADPPNLPGAETRDRYNLPLQDLLFDHGEDFARAIGRESAGGFDLSAAAAALGFDKKPNPRSTKETDSVLQLGRLVQDRRQRLDALRRREQELEEHIRQRDAARHFAARIPRLKAALNLADALGNQQHAQSRLASFPVGVAKLTGREAEQIRQFRADIADKERAIERWRQELDRARAALAAIRFSGAPPTETVVATLVGFARELVAVKNQITAQEQEVQAAAARRTSAATAIGPSISEEKLHRLDLQGIDGLAAFAREAEKSRADLAARESVRNWLTAALPAANLGSSAGDDAAEVERLSEGLRLLARWLRQPAAPPAPSDDDRWLVLTAAGLIALLALLLAWQWHPVAAIFALAGPLLYYIWHRRRAPGAIIADARPLLQQQYVSLRLDAPAAWSFDAVEQTSRLLLDRLSATKLRKERADRLADQLPQIEAARRRDRDLAARREQLAARLGLAPNVDESFLYALVESVLRWQQAAADLAAAAARRASLQDQFDHILTLAATLLRQYDYDIPDSASLDAACDDLRRRCEAHRTASATIAELKARIEDSQREIAEMSSRQEAIFTTIGLVPADDATLQQWLDMRLEHGRAKSALEIATAKARELGDDLREEPDLIRRPPAELESELSVCGEKADAIQSLTEKIAEIRKEIELAKGQTELEETQVRQRDAAAALAASREEDCDLAAGWVLLEHLRAITRERHQSAVFRRAREIFARITRGRYLLEVDDGDGPPVFRCIDRNRGMGQSLEELSSGTRVQLFLAVRVAFVEQQEQGPRLPLILDETLANSDETRARQILDAIIEICRSGRQIFYFTAQPDEVGKWREVLEAQRGDNPPQYRLIDLAAVRGLAESERTPARQIVTAPAALVPPPADLDRDAYGRLLHVPGIDPWQETAGGVHLWHLIDDLPILHKLLSMGIRSWGQWKTMAEYGGLAVADSVEIFNRAQARSRLLESIAHFWRIGRGKPVDRQAIVDSKAIRPTFLEAVVELAAAESGDARRMIAALENGAIKGFRGHIIERFKEWLQDNAYLDSRTILSPDDIRVRALAQCEKDIQSNMIDAAEVEKFLAAVS